RVADEHPRVRLEAICSLARIPSPRAVEVMMTARRRPLTPLIEYALQMGANELKPVWLPAFQEGRLNFGGNQDDLNYALRAVESPAALNTIVSQLEFDTVPKEQREQMLDLISSVGGAREASLLLELALRDEKSYDAAGKVRLLGRLEQMARTRNIKPGGFNKELPRLFNDASPAVRAAALRVAGAHKREDLREPIAKLGLRYVNTTGRDDPALTARLREAAGLNAQ